MKTRTDLERVGAAVLDEARTELFLSMPYLAPAMGRLEHRMDLTTRLIATDGEMIRYSPVGLIRVYREHPYVLTRTYLHLLLHCLFRHVFESEHYPDEELWNLSADIASEHVIDSMDNRAVNRTASDFREEWYRKLEKEVRVLTAERIYAYFEYHPLPYELLVKLSNEFLADDHVFWRMLDEKKKPRPRSDAENELASRLQNEWRKAAKRVSAAMEAKGPKAGAGTGNLDVMLRADSGNRTDFRELLKKFAVVREEMRVDPDSFDYGFYWYGLSHYGNLPLIEENEFAESEKVEELVIAIDTSASCDADAVRAFLGQTAAVLSDGSRFFRRVRIHILTCDTEVRGDVLLTKAEEMKKYAEGFHVEGGGGTDFRPVFAYVSELIRKKDLRRLKGLLYFTDGFGIYPKRPTPYTTAFVFRENHPCDADAVPPWALKLYMKE